MIHVRGLCGPERRAYADTEAVNKQGLKPRWSALAFIHTRRLAGAKAMRFSYTLPATLSDFKHVIMPQDATNPKDPSLVPDKGPQRKTKVGR